MSDGSNIGLASTACSGAPRFSCSWPRGRPGAAVPRGSRRTRLEGILAVDLPLLLVRKLPGTAGLQACEIKSVISCVFA